MEVGGPLGRSVGGGGGTLANNRVGEPGTGCPSSRGFPHARNPNTILLRPKLYFLIVIITLLASDVLSIYEGAGHIIVVLCWRSSEPGAARTKKQVLRADT